MESLSEGVIYYNSSNTFTSNVYISAVSKYIWVNFLSMKRTS